MYFNFILLTAVKFQSFEQYSLYKNVSFHDGNEHIQMEM